MPAADITTVESAGAASATVLERVRTMLGVRGLRTDHDVMTLVEARLPVRALDGLRHAGLTDDELYALVLPRRTLTHRRARREPLTRDESDRVVRVARVLALSHEVFGEAERAWNWLRDAKRQFRRRTPLDVLATESGARWVERQDHTRAIGDGWLRDGRSVLLRVPSAVVPETFNVLLNTSHAQAGRIPVAHVSDHPIDPRLLR